VAKRRERRTVWGIIGTLGLFLLAVELIVAPPGPLQWSLAFLGLVTALFATVKYRSLAPRRREFFDR